MRQLKLLTLLAMIMALVVTSTVIAQDDLSCDPSDPVLFGFVADNSGVGVLFAESQFKGIDMAMADLNANGGILGRCVEYIWQDAELNASQGAIIAEQFILEDEVDFLIGPTSSSVALAVTEVSRDNAIPIAFHTSNSIQLSNARFNPYGVQVAPHTTIETRAIAQFASQLGLNDWAAIGPDYAFGRDGFSTFAPELLENNPDAEILTEQWPALGEADLGPYLTAIEAIGPEAIFSNIWGDQLVNFITLAEEFDLFSEVTFFGLLDTDVMKTMGADMPEGLYGYARAPFYAIDTEQMADFNERFLEIYDEYPSDWAILAYDAVLVLAAAAEEAGTVDGDAVSAALDDLTFTALRGELTVRGCDHITNAPDYIGVTTFSEEYNLPILTDIVEISAEEVWDSCEDIEAERAAAE
ncbi:MAG: ABC transporter substrate-binding protein [Chloroflexota bacterium]